MATVNEKMTAIADLIRSYTGLDDKLGLDDMHSEVSAIIETINLLSEGNYTQEFFGIMNKDLTSLSCADIEQVGDYVFTNCNLLESVSLPNVTKIGNHAFDCANEEEFWDEYDYEWDKACNPMSVLKTVDIPLVQSIGDYAFYCCSMLTSVDFPKVTTIGKNAFSGAGIDQANFPNVLDISERAFYGMIAKKEYYEDEDYPEGGYYYASEEVVSKLVSANFPIAKSIGNSAFYSCESLTDVNFH